MVLVFKVQQPQRGKPGGIIQWKQAFSEVWPLKKSQKKLIFFEIWIYDKLQTRKRTLGFPNSLLIRDSIVDSIWPSNSTSFIIPQAKWTSSNSNIRSLKVHNLIILQMSPQCNFSKNGSNIPTNQKLSCLDSNYENWRKSDQGRRAHIFLGIRYVTAASFEGKRIYKTLCLLMLTKASLQRRVIWL